MGCINFVLSLINKIIPKQKKILFNSFPDIDGNALALYEYIITQRLDITSEYKLIWTVKNISENKAQEILFARCPIYKHRVVMKKSLCGIWTFLCSEFVISTHSYFRGVRYAKNQKDINLWHGMPLKKIGRLLETGHSSNLEDEAEMTIVTSPVFRKVMADAFGISEEKVFVTGLPRNDALLKESHISEVLDIDKADKIIFWLPTYRNSCIGEIRIDGKTDGFGVTEVLLQHFDELNNILKKNNYILLIKPHPMDEINKMSFPQSPNIHVIKNDDLAERNIQLYELLSGCDILITDYSSVYIDYLITGKPIAFVCEDISEYGSSRGFCFENPLDYMPGEKIYDINGLINYFNNMDELNQKWKDSYEKVKDEFNLYCDSNSSRRVCETLWGNNRGE